MMSLHFAKPCEGYLETALHEEEEEEEEDVVVVEVVGGGGERGREIWLSFPYSKILKKS